MVNGMPQAHQHQFYRHPAMPWTELRVSQHSPHSYRLHMHAEYSLGLVDAGHALFTHPRGLQPIQAGDTVWIEPHVWHACNPAQAPHWSYRMLYIQADWLHAQLGVAALQFGQHVLHAPDLHQTLGALCQQLQHDCIDAAAWCQQLLALLQSQSAVLQPCTAESTPPAAHTAIQHTLQSLHAHPDTAPTIQMLADAQGMSASCLIRHFKAATGVTPGNYRLNMRLNGARQLLAQGMALADAAHAMGFADQAPLKRTTPPPRGVTPALQPHSIWTPCKTLSATRLQLLKRSPCRHTDHHHHTGWTCHFPPRRLSMFTLLMVIASTLIVGGLMAAVMSMEQTLTDHPGDL